MACLRFARARTDSIRNEAGSAAAPETKQLARWVFQQPYWSEVSTITVSTALFVWKRAAGWQVE
jgi:hypothetical protein